MSLFLLVALLAALAVIWSLAGRDVQTRLARLSARASLLETPHGTVEYALEGTGPPALVVHGAGGGFDQGLLIAAALGGDGVRWIAPSRFGYLGSPLPADASTAAQAAAFAALLDHLQIERVAILAFSGGAPPALQFAARYPERTRALVLLSRAPFTPYRAQIEGRPLPEWLYTALFGNDAAYWLLARLMPGRLLTAFDARPELRAGLSEAESRFVQALLDSFLPASRRLAGVRNEAAAIAPDARYALGAIAAPTLVIHARDDRINPFAVGEDIAARVPGAQLVAFDTGGHLLLGRHGEVRAHVRRFLPPAEGAAAVGATPGPPP